MHSSLFKIIHGHLTVGVVIIDQPLSLCSFFKSVEVL